MKNINSIITDTVEFFYHYKLKCKNKKDLYKRIRTLTLSAFGYTRKIAPVITVVWVFAFTEFTSKLLETN